jgi:NADP-dependent 3-hydroxy acid dehydrogenase YdfG
VTSLAGRVALVTGASRGIGRATALALAREGCAVALVARGREALAEAAAAVRDVGGRALAIPADVTQDAAVEAVVDQTVAELGRLDVLVTAAGVASFGPVAGAKPADWDPMLAVNLRAAMVCCRAVLPVMARQRGGVIVNLGSVAATRTIAGTAAYAATKAGLLAFSRVLAEEVRRDGIRVAVFHAGATDTALWDAVPGAPDRSRMLRAEDVARAVVLAVALAPRAALEELTLLPPEGVL